MTLLFTCLLTENTEIRKAENLAFERKLCEIQTIFSFIKNTRVVVQMHSAAIKNAISSININ